MNYAFFSIFAVTEKDKKSLIIKKTQSKNEKFKSASQKYPYILLRQRLRKCPFFIV